MSYRVLFNALQAAPTGTGISRYAVELARELGALRDDVLFAVQERMAASIGLDRSRLMVMPDATPSWRRILAEQLLLPLRGRRFELVHYPDSIGPLVGFERAVVTVHDLSFLDDRAFFTRAQRTWKTAATRASAAKAIRLICPSRWTAEDVQRRLGVPQEKIRVIYSGVRLREGPSRKPDSPLPSEPFILYVGTLHPRKNVGRLLEAIAMLEGTGCPRKLVIAGERGWMYQESLGRPYAELIQRHAVFAGYCGDLQLKWLYEHAVLLAYVSLHEGFGFPPLEAMACGLPVVAARASCLPEICGEAALYVDPLSPNDIARGIREVCEDEPLRSRLVAAGKERAGRFDWRRTSMQVSAVYNEILG